MKNPLLIIRWIKAIFLSLLLVLSAGSVKSAKPEFRLLTWNIANFGLNDSSKFDSLVAIFLKNDIVCVQEVNKGDGKQGCLQLLEQLRKSDKGHSWDMRCSNPTTELHQSERYAFFWNTNVLHLSEDPILAEFLEHDMAREPFCGKFEIDGKHFMVATIHAIPKAKHPEIECALLYKLDSAFAKENLIICGDFNLSERNQLGFDNLKNRGFSPALTNQKTSLRTKVDAAGTCLSEEYDNVFYEEKHIGIKHSGILDLTRSCTTLSSARHLSDHLPVYCEIVLY